MRVPLIVACAGLTVSMWALAPSTAGPVKPEAEGAKADPGRGVFRIPEGEFRPRRRVSALSLQARAETQDWGLGANGVRVAAAWQVTKGKGVKVAILDTGVDANHPELKGRVTLAKDFTGSPTGAADVQGHGTHCAGIVGMAENGAGYVGVAPEVEIISGKVLDDNGSGDFAWLKAGIDWAVEQKADVISMSLGSGPTSTPPDQFFPDLRASIKKAVDAGIIVVAAAGNEGPSPSTTGYPGKYPEVITVASSDVNRNVSPFSSRGPEVDVAAPGDDITSCLPGGLYATWDGTSMATPCVAGVAALYVAGKRAAAAPDNKPTPAEFRKLIQAKSQPLMGQTPPTTSFGWGLIQAPAFVTAQAPKEDAITFTQADFTPGGWAKFQKAMPGVDTWTFKFNKK
jgi:subtilisin family serine protease